MPWEKQQLDDTDVYHPEFGPMIHSKMPSYRVYVSNTHADLSAHTDVRTETKSFLNQVDMWGKV